MKLQQSFLPKLRARWKTCRRIKARFEEKNDKWLHVVECLDIPVCQEAAENVDTPGGSRGRPALPFREKSRRAKQQATAELRRSATTPELVFSAASAVHQEGRRRAARLLEEAGSPGRGGLLVSRAAETPEPHHSLTTEEALAVTVDLDLTKAQYSNMRLTAEEHGCKLYPAYKRVAKAKAECLPPASAFTVLPDQAQVDLQPLLDKTATRLLQLQKPVLDSLPGRLPIQLVLHCKWGIDGSTGHSQYKQAGVQQDDRMLVTTLVPLQLETGVGEVIWRNPTPSSTRFCRPIRLQLATETKAVSQEELQRVGAEISALQPLSTPTAVVRYELAMTMVSNH